MAKKTNNSLAMFFYNCSLPTSFHFFSGFCRFKRLESFQFAHVAACVFSIGWYTGYNSKPIPTKTQSTFLGPVHLYFSVCMKPVGQNLTLAKVSLACVRREGAGGCQVLQFGKQTSDEYSNIKGEVENLFSISG